MRTTESISIQDSMCSIEGRVRTPKNRARQSGEIRNLSHHDPSGSHKFRHRYDRFPGSLEMFDHSEGDADIEGSNEIVGRREEVGTAHVAFDAVP